MKDCAEYREMISQMADGELTEPHKTELARHMASCPDCRRLYDAFAFISSSLAEGMAEPPETLRTGISGELRARKAQKAAARRRRRRTAAFTALAACAALVVVVAARVGLPNMASSGAAVRSDTQAAETAEGTPADGSQTDTVRTEDADVLPETGSSALTGCVQQPEEAPVPSPDQNILTTGGGESTYSGTVGQENLVSLPSGQTSGTAADADKVSMIRLFAGAVTPTEGTAPELTVTDETSIAFLMEQLACSEASEEDAVSGDPAFTLAVTAEDGDYVLSVWITDGRLYCRSDRDSVLYVAAGDAGDLMDFIAEA